MLRHYKRHAVLQKVEYSMSESGRFRFEKKCENGRIYVRAVYGRRMERVSAMKILCHLTIFSSFEFNIISELNTYVCTYYF